MNVNRLLRSAIKAASSVDSHTTIDPTEYEDALESCNMMLKLWATQGVIIHHVITEQFNLVVGQASYTIGDTANFNTSRPNQITGGFVRVSDTDYPIQIIDRDRYNSLRKTDTGIPQYLYYYPTYPIATIYLYKVPDETYLMSIDSIKPLTELVLDADLNLPPEYEEAIKWNLAVRLAPDYKTTPRQDVVMMAKQSYNALSIQPIPAAFCNDAPGIRADRYSIYAG